MDIGRNPEAERIGDRIRALNRFKKFIDIVESQMTIVQQDPRSILERLAHKFPGMYLLTLAH